MLDDWLIKTFPGPRSWHNRHPIPRVMSEGRDPMFDFLPDAKLVVEIGAQWGWWTHRAAKQLPNATIYSVDPWSDDPISVRHYRGGVTNLYDWCLNVAPWLGKNVFALRGKSEEVAMDFFEPIDLLFLDGDHTREAVLRDLQLWEPRVRAGGVVVGHDWSGPWKKHVRPAVRDYLGPNIRSPRFAAERCYFTRRGLELSQCFVWRK